MEKSRVLSPKDINSSKKWRSSGFLWSKLLLFLIRKSTFCLPFQDSVEPLNKNRYQPLLGGVRSGCCSSVHCLKLEAKKRGVTTSWAKAGPPNFRRGGSLKKHLAGLLFFFLGINRHVLRWWVGCPISSEEHIGSISVLRRREASFVCLAWTTLWTWPVVKVKGVCFVEALISW